MGWSQEDINILVKLWLDGKSASSIADTIGNVSRNAVIGKIHRLGIANRDVIIEEGLDKKIIVSKSRKSSKNMKNLLFKKDTIALKKDVEKIKIRKDFKLKKSSKNNALFSVLELTDKTCKWPIGHPDDAEFHFCGNLTKEGSPYCDHHSRIAYTHQTPIKEKNLTEPEEDKAKKTPMVDDQVAEYSSVL